MNSGDEAAADDRAKDSAQRLEPSVVAALYLEHGEELRRFLQGVLRDAQLAADVLQATFVKLSERGHETRPPSRKAWLFRVAFHEAMAYRRREAVGDKIVRRVADQSGQVGTSSGTWPSNGAAGLTGDPLVRLESVQVIQAALDELPPEQRQVVRMRIYEEKTFAVIAKELKIPLGTALARMRAALIKLRTRLDQGPDQWSG